QFGPFAFRFDVGDVDRAVLRLHTDGEVKIMMSVRQKEWRQVFRFQGFVNLGDRRGLPSGGEYAVDHAGAGVKDHTVFAPSAKGNGRRSFAYRFSRASCGGSG